MARGPGRRPRGVARLLAAALAVLAVLAAGASCTPAETAQPSPTVSPLEVDTAPPAAAPDPGQVFRAAVREPTAITPGEVADPDGLLVVDALFDSLTTYGPRAAGATATVLPAAAETWTASPDRRVWTFTLRETGTWHDGTPVRAADVAFAWSRLVRRGASGHLLENVAGYADVVAGRTTSLAGVAAVDERTLQVSLSTGVAEFDVVAAHPALAPVHTARVVADPAGHLEEPVGNGPFAMVGRWAHGEFIRVRSSPSWSVGRGPATVPEVLFNVRTADAAYADFALGRLDWAPVPAGAVDAAIEEYGLVEDGGTGVLDIPAPQLYFLGMDLAAPPLDDREVRRALSLAIDRRALARASRDGSADVAISAIPPAIPGGRPSGCAWCRYDPARARELFEAAGVTELELWFSDGGGHEEIAGLISEQLAAVGVAMELRSTGPSLAGYLGTLRSGEAPLFRFGWTAEHPTLDAALRPLLSRSAAGRDGAANYGRYSDPAVEALMNEARADPDPASRVARYARVQALALDRDQAIVPLLTLRQVRLVSARTLDLELDVTGAPELERIRLRPGSPPG